MATGKNKNCYNDHDEVLDLSQSTQQERGGR